MMDDEIINLSPLSEDELALQTLRDIMLEDCINFGDLDAQTVARYIAARLKESGFEIRRI